MEQKDLEDGFFWLNIVQYGLAGFLHCTGLVVLWKLPKQTNQNVILFYLSLTEVNLVIPGVTLRIHVDKVSYLTQLPETILLTIEHTAIFELAFMMYILTVDRLICCIDPLKYQSRVTKKRIRIAVALTTSFAFILSFLNDILYHLVDKETHSLFDSVIYYFVIIAGSAYVMVAIITYIFIFWVARKSRSASQISRGGRRKQRYLIYGVIILTFLFLYVIPFVFQAIDYFDLNDLHRFLVKEVTRTLMIFGMISDPIVYIFLSKHYRAIIIAKCRNIFSCGETLRRTQVESRSLNVEQSFEMNQETRHKILEENAWTKNDNRKG